MPVPSRPDVPPELLTSWASPWSDVSVLVVGLGEGGFALADTLVELGATTHVLVEGHDPDRSTILGVLGVSVHSAGSGDDIVSAARDVGPDLVLLSPDWNPDREVEKDLWASGLTVWSDVEFSWRVADKYGKRPDMVFCAGEKKGNFLADVAQKFLRHASLRAARGGHDAPSVLDAFRHPDGVDVVLWTLSDRQLWRMGGDESSQRRPRVSVYFAPQEDSDLSSLQALYQHTAESCLYQPGTLSEIALQRATVVEGARAIGIVADTPGMSDLGRVDEVICDRAFLPDRRDRALELCTVEELVAAGFSTPELVEVAIAALGIARALDVPPEVLGGALHVGNWPKDK